MYFIGLNRDMYAYIHINKYMHAICMSICMHICKYVYIHMCIYT